MNTHNQILAQLFANSSFIDLVSHLLAEPFAEKNQFISKNLEEIGKFIDESREKLENPETLSESLLEELESFKRCKTSYCLILMELELSSFNDLPKEKMEEIKNYTPQIGRAIYEPEGDSMSEKTMIGLGISGSLVKNKKNEVVMEKLEEDLPILEPITPLLTHEIEPVIEMEIEEEEIHELGLNHIEETPDGWEEFSKKAQSFECSSYIHLAKSLQEKSFSDTTAGLWKYCGRMVGQSFSWGLECEIFERLKHSLHLFWAERSKAIIPLLSNQSKGMELDPRLKLEIDALTQKHPDLLLDKRFPTQAMASSLRYILATTSIDKFSPAPLDLAALLFFFGQSRELGATLNNHLQISGISQSEIIEVTMRLARIQKNKARLTSPHITWEESHLNALEEDVKACLPLVLKIEIANHSGLEAVA